MKQKGTVREMKKPKGPDPVKRDLVYQFLNGFIDGEQERQTGEQMQIAFLTEQIYQRRLNLWERVGLEFENKDMEAIMDAYEKMNRLIGDFMYDHGWLDAALTNQE